MPQVRLTGLRAETVVNQAVRLELMLVLIKGQKFTKTAIRAVLKTH